MTTPATEPLRDDEARRLARKRIQSRRDLGTHVVTYLVVNTFLVLIWFLSGQGYFWPAWVMGGWGIGLVLNAWEVYGRKPITEADVDAELRRTP
jgi:2TM domain